MSLNKYLMIKSAVRYDNYGMAIPDDEEPEPGVPLGGGSSNKSKWGLPGLAWAFGRNKNRPKIGYGGGDAPRMEVPGPEVPPPPRRPNARVGAAGIALPGPTGAPSPGGTSPGPGGGALPPGAPPFIADDWDRAEYYRAMANKENNLGALTLGGGALTGGVAAMLLNKYYNKDKFRSWLDEKLKASPDSRYGRTIGSINRAVSELLPGMSTAAASLLGGIGTRWLANKLHKRYKRIPKPGTSSELAAAAKEEYLNGGFDGTNLPGGWYVPPVENSKGILRPAYGVADPVPAPEQSRGVEYWNPQVKSGPIHRHS